MRALSKTIPAGILALAAACSSPPPPAPDAQFAQGSIVAAPPPALTLLERRAVVNATLRERLTEVLPRLMRDATLDCWLVINRENNEDPVYLTLVPEPAFSARRTTILVFIDPGPGQEIERLTVSRYPISDIYKSVWNGGSDDEQWARLAEILRERNPRRIGIDISRDWGHADGLSAGLRDRLVEALGPMADRLRPAHELCIRWLESRVVTELQMYPDLVAIARGIISEAFSEKVITPGLTTTDDVAWFIRNRYAQLGVDTWFMPDVNVQRRGLAAEGAFSGKSGIVIERGDVLHTDMGIRALRLCTDTQEMGYVLRSGETEPPAGLIHALEIGNRWQDLLTAEFRAGRTGNEILASTREAAAKEGIVCSVYSHPLGYFGHGPGPTIGMWDNQGPTPVRGEWMLLPNTCYAIEGNVTVPIPEWGGQKIQIKLEQSAVFTGARVRYLAGRQTQWHVVR